MILENKIIDCYEIANKLQNDLVIEVQKLQSKNIQPSFATILVGENPASLVYVKNKQKKAELLNINNKMYRLSENISQEELLDLVNLLNEDKKIHGILIQLPLPSHINSMKVVSSINPKKDIDGLNPLNIGYLSLQNENGFVPCTPLGCLHIIKTIEPNLAGKKAVVVGRSNLVGLPMAHLLLNNNATVSIVHSKTKNIAEICKQSDIVVCAIGRPNFIDSTHIKQGALVVDVGISKIEVDGKPKIVGDVNMESVLPLVSHITPVPKGVGLLTIMFLMHNIIKSAKQTNMIV
jgi:methylenetetrahydrofolate dehydrogenase (NADP+)/methenyltetrahydrofolate cyclohydrolase